MQGCINFLFSSIQRFLWMDQDSTLALSSLLLLQARFSLHSHAHITNVIWALFKANILICHSRKAQSSEAGPVVCAMVHLLSQCHSVYLAP